VKKAGPNFSGSLVLLFRGNEVVDDSRTESLPLKLTLCLLKVLYAPYKIQRSGHTPITTSVLPENQLWPGNCWVLLLSPTYCCFSYPWSCLPVLWGSGFTRQLGARSKGPGWRSIIHNAHAWEGGRRRHITIYKIIQMLLREKYYINTSHFATYFFIY
jgi:hypothetical protein